MSWTIILLWVGSTVLLCLLEYRVRKLEVLFQALTMQFCGIHERQEKAIAAFESMMAKLDELDSERAKLADEIKFALGTIENWKRNAQAVNGKAKDAPH